MTNKKICQWRNVSGWIWFIVACVVCIGCTPIQIAPEIERTGFEQYPTREEQLRYDNFMLGRLKYHDADANSDLISAAFLDSRNNQNGRLDEHEKQLLQMAIDKVKLYFTVGAPMYNPARGREVTKQEMNNGKATNNPLDYFQPADQKRWQQLLGTYLTFEDARVVFRKSPSSAIGENLWGIIEVDFSPCRFGKPFYISHVWRAYDNGSSIKYLAIPFNAYRLNPEICKLLGANFKLIYVP
jgi:hypothetical protein